MRTRIFLSLILALVFTAATIAFAPSWDIADTYAIKFTTQKAEGTFSDLQGTIEFDADDLATARFDVWVATASIETDNKTKTRHARKSSWLDAEAHPRISFVSERFAKVEEGYEVTGTLTIKGVDQEVVWPFTFAETENGGLFEGTVTVHRQAFGVEGPFLFGGLVGDLVEVSLRVPVEQSK